MEHEIKHTRGGVLFKPVNPKRLGAYTVMSLNMQ